MSETKQASAGKRQGMEPSRGQLTGASLQNRLRSDLEVHPRTGVHGDEVWICDPIRGTVARLDRGEFDLLIHSLAAPRDELSPNGLRLIEEASRHQFLRCNPRSASLLLQVSNKKSSLPNPLTIRLPGIAADGLARRIAKRSGWLFSSPAVLFWGTLVFISFCILVGRAPEFWQSARSLGQFQARYWGLTMGILALTKLVHEVAHAAVCRRMGAHCREIGVLLLCGIPTLYCDVSDSWRIASARQRSAVMLAGVYVELIIAAIAIWYWMLVKSPLGQMIAVNTIVLCGISSVLFNLNPLMRYDGYFVIADWLNLPNLRQRASSHWRYLLMGPTPVSGGWNTSTVSLDKAKKDRSGTFSKAFFAIYHLASTSYRYFIFGGLLFWGYHVGQQAGVEPIARSIALAVVGMVIASALIRWFRMVRGSGDWRIVRAGRRFIIATVTLLAVCCIGWIPFQKRIAIHGTVDFAHATTLYIPETATIRHCNVKLGQTVRASESLLQLEETTLFVQQIRFQSEVERLVKCRELLVDHALGTPDFLSQLPLIDAALKSATEQLSEVDQAIGKLTILAPHDGVILPLAASHQATYQQAKQSSGAHLRDNLTLVSSQFQTVEKGKPWCRVGDPKMRKVIFRIDAHQRQSFVEGGAVRIVIPALGSSAIQTKIQSIAQFSEPTSGSHHETIAVASDLGTASSQFILTCDLPLDATEYVPAGASVEGVARGAPISLFPWLFRAALGIPQ